MKITIDFDTKTVTVNDGVNLSDFVNKIQTVLPDWTDFTLVTLPKIVEKEKVVYRDPLPDIFNPKKPGQWLKPNDLPNPIDIRYDNDGAIHKSKFKVGDSPVGEYYGDGKSTVEPANIPITRSADRLPLLHTLDVSEV